MPRIESVNIGAARRAANNTGSTGIYKFPAAGDVAITALGLDGDHVADKRHHGGPDQAVYIYFSDDYAYWTKALGRSLDPGTFGENLTISGLRSADMAIGDRLVAGDVVLEVTAPRTPCRTLAARMGDLGFVKTFRAAERPGAYCRVIEPGRVAAGMAVAHDRYAGKRVGIVDMYRAASFARTLSGERIREVLAAPIAIRERAKWEKRLAKIEPEI